MAAQKSEISAEEFDQLVEEQQEPEILNFSDLEIGAVYQIEKTETIETSKGTATIIILSGDERVWATSILTNKLKDYKNKNVKPPFLIKPKGERKSKKTGNYYYDFVLVKYEKK